MIGKASPSSFRVITLFILFSIIGISLLPVLQVNYLPSQKSDEISVSFMWFGGNPEIVEREVTSKLEGVLATLDGVASIDSESLSDRGYIRLRFDVIKDPQALRNRVSSLIRQVSPGFPDGVTVPEIYFGQKDNSSTLFSLTLNGHNNLQELQLYASTHIKRELSLVKGVKKVSVFGVKPEEWIIEYDIKKLTTYGLSQDDLRSAIDNYFLNSPLGLVSPTPTVDEAQKQISVFLAHDSFDSDSWSDIPVALINDRIINLSDICQIRKRAKKPDSFYRINGLNSLDIVISSESGSNQFVLGNRVKQTIRELESNLPDSMSLRVSYDSTKYLHQELRDIVWRVAWSVLILIFFASLTYRSKKYLLCIVLGVICNLSIAFTLYFLLGIELHLFSLAGITISLGIIIDNTIFVISHYKTKGSSSVFRPVLAATLTTIGSILVVFVLDQSDSAQLVDFALVLAVNLAVSLAVSTFLIPALIRTSTDAVRVNASRVRQKRILVRLNNAYGNWIVFISRFKILVVVFLILLFGLPVHLLPEKVSIINLEGHPKANYDIELRNYLAKAYNGTLGSDWYRENLHDYVLMAFGGTIRVFSETALDGYSYETGGRTKLYLKGQMAPGANIDQMNRVFIEWEKFLSQFEGVSLFETSVKGISDATITIEFHPDFENSGFPYYLKSRLQERALSVGGIDTEIYGVGKGFNNSLGSGYRNTNLLLRGYNYPDLLIHAFRIKEELEMEFDRVAEVELRGRVERSLQQLPEYFIDLDLTEMTRKGVTLSFLHEHLNTMSRKEFLVGRYRIGNSISEVKLKSGGAESGDKWKIFNETVTLPDGSSAKLRDFSRISQRESNRQIIRTNQEYQLVLAFEFLGTKVLIDRKINPFVQRVQKELPLGYSIERSGFTPTFGDSHLWTILVAIIVVYFLGAILLESLRQPLFVLCLIPVSFIGVFLTFIIFNVNFDQGGYASFILLSGLSVNSGFFVFYDFNEQRRTKPNQPLLRSYLKAFQKKISPILLTTLSTVVGLIPFIISSETKAFWSALAVGTFGGLIFSILALLLVLPFVMKKSHLISGVKP